MARENGSSLLELLIILILLALLVTMTTSATTTVLRRTDLRSATGRVRNILELANAEGQTRGAYRAVRFFTVGNEWFYAIYEDGNGNGVHSSEINRGVDHLIEGPRRLLGPETMAHPGFPASGIVDPDTDRPIASDERPVQFGAANLCSFSDYGACTPGTIYLTDGVSAGALVRCSGASGRIRVMYYGLNGSQWSN